MSEVNRIVPPVGREGSVLPSAACARQSLAAPRQPSPPLQGAGRQALQQQLLRCEVWGAALTGGATAVAAGRGSEH